MEEIIIKEHVVLILTDRSIEELRKRLKPDEKKITQISEHKWEYETDIETEQDLFNLRRFTLMFADMITIKEGKAFRNNIIENMMAALKKWNIPLD